MIELIELKSGPGGTIYTVLLKGEKRSEFEKFLCDKEINKSPYLQEILPKIDEMVKEIGFQAQFFNEKVSSIYDNVVRFKHTGNLRLYCCRFGNIILILGSGGIKKTRTYQEDSKLYNAVKLMTKISKLVEDKIRAGDIYYENDKFEGELILNDD